MSFKKIMYALFVCAELLLIAHLCVGLPYLLGQVPFLVAHLAHVWQQFINFWVAISPIINGAKLTYLIIIGMHKANHLMYSFASFVAHLTSRFIVQPFVRMANAVFNFAKNFLFYSCLKGMNLFDLKVSPGSFFYNKCREKLREAVLQGDTKKVNLLLEVGVNINATINPYGDNALSLTILANRNIGLIVFLLEKGANFGTFSGNYYFLIQSIQMLYGVSSPELFKQLLDKVPEAEINTYLFFSGVGNAVGIYRNNKLNHTVFESVLALARKIIQHAGKNRCDRGLLRFMLGNIKPTWCTDAQFQTLLDTTIDRVFKSLNKVYKNRAEMAKQRQEADKMQALTEEVVMEPSQQVISAAVELAEPAEVLQFSTPVVTPLVVSNTVAANDESVAPEVATENKKKPA